MTARKPEVRIHKQERVIRHTLAAMLALLEGIDTRLYRLEKAVLRTPSKRLSHEPVGGASNTAAGDEKSKTGGRK